MSELDQFLLNYEAEEAASEMFFSTYYVPSYYQPSEADELGE